MGPMSDDDLTMAIRATLADSPFHGEGHRKVWARLRFAGVRTSLRRVLRPMRQNDLSGAGACWLTARGADPRRHHHSRHRGYHVGTDLTATFTGEGQAAVFIAVDHFTAECVGIHASSRAARFEALEPIRQGVRRHFGGFAKDVAHGLADPPRSRIAVVPPGVV
jgi:putative transposase